MLFVQFKYGAPRLWFFWLWIAAYQKQSYPFGNLKIVGGNYIKVYRCYSNNLKEFLISGGLRYLIIALDIVTKKTFWLFEKTDEFENLMNQWQENSPNK